MKRFFSYTAGYCWFETFDTEAEAQANMEACFDAVMDGAPQHLKDELGDWYWGEIRGLVDDGEVVALNAHPNSEVGSLRAEPAALRARVGAVLAELQEMEKLYRQDVRSAAHGEYSFQRAEAYEHAIDLLEGALDAPEGEE